MEPWRGAPDEFGNGPSAEMRLNWAAELGGISRL
jgi:hypothetical protein